jgi:hypothetical protein
MGVDAAGEDQQVPRVDLLIGIDAGGIRQDSDDLIVIDNQVCLEFIGIGNQQATGDHCPLGHGSELPRSPDHGAWNGAVTGHRLGAWAERRRDR